MKLSIAMIVKNEEKFIESTLRPLRKLGDFIDCEIIIVDTGSTDNTVEIAKKYTDKIYFHEWNNNFGDMRNISISYCIGDWILVVDADEVLYDVEELANLVSNKKFYKYNGSMVKIIDFNMDLENSLNTGYTSYMLRIFKRGTVKYKGIVHEQPEFKYPITEENIRFIHYGYNNNDYELMEYKFNRNISLLFEELKHDPSNLYVNYQLAVSYSMHKELKEALKYIDIAYKLGEREIGKYIYVIDKYCLILFNSGKFDSLLEKAREGIKYCNDFIDFYFYSGEASYNLKDYENAIKYYETYLRYHDKLENNFTISNNTLSVITRKYKNNILYNLCLSCYKTNLYEKALDTIMKIEDYDILKDRAYVILKIIVEGRLWAKINILNEYIDKYNYENILVYVHKEVLLEDLKILSESKLERSLKDIVYLVKFFKGNNNDYDKAIIKIKTIIDETKIPYSTYIYYLLKYDICEIKYLLIYGKDKIENMLINLCSNYFDFNAALVEGLNKIRCDNFPSIVSRTVMEKALLLSGKLPSDKQKSVFLNYVAEKYYSIIKSYDRQLIEDNAWMLPSEDRFIIELKHRLQYKYEDTLKYVKSMKDILNLEKSYINYIKLLIGEGEENIRSEIKAFIPELVNSIEGLINSEKYQEAYNNIEEGLTLVKFDFDLMVIRYELLKKFDYLKESYECLNQIILYGEDKRVIKFIDDYL